MNEDCLKLTTYFGERDRCNGRLVADELLDIYGARQAAISILLRGAEGFGTRHHRHTDRLLTLSEDLPVVTVAVDGRERIESLLERVLEVKSRGLVTLERARMLTGELDEVRLPDQLGEATKLTVYLGRYQRARGRPAFVEVCELLQRRGIAGATVLLGVDGTRQGLRTRARFFAANAQVPMMIIAVGAGDRIAACLTELGELVPEPLVTLERVRVCKRDGVLLARPHSLPGRDDRGRAIWQKLMVYTSQAATHEGRPLSLEIVRRLRRSELAGATSLRGVWGFHGDHPPHGDKLVQLRRHVPVVTIAVDTPPRTARAFAIIDELTTEHGLVTSEMVPAVAALDETEPAGSLRLARHDF